MAEIDISADKMAVEKAREEKASGTYCSFCGKSTRDVRNLIAGPKVYICEECVALSVDIISEKDPSFMSEFKLEKCNEERLGYDFVRKSFIWLKADEKVARRKRKSNANPKRECKK